MTRGARAVALVALALVYLGLFRHPVAMLMLVAWLALSPVAWALFVTNGREHQDETLLAIHAALLHPEFETPAWLLSRFARLRSGA